MPDTPAARQIATRPPGIGWFWWRKNESDPWKAVEVHDDRGDLYSRSDKDMEYQCGDNPETPFTGQWWPDRLEPPPA